MKTLKNGLKQENIDSNHVRKILTDYSHKDCVKVALYCAEDCSHFTVNKNDRRCIELVKKWLTGKKIRNSKLDDAAYISWEHYGANEDNSSSNSNGSIVNCIWSITDIVNSRFYAANSFDWAVSSFSVELRGMKEKEYCFYARLFAYEDLSYPYKDFSKTFNLDNPTDLNIFLDFLTDNYPTAITYPREEYFKTKLAKEYLKVIYQ